MTQGTQPSTDRELRAAERAHDHAKELQFQLVDAATSDAREAMKIALAINGGTAIAVLAFLGAYASKDVSALAKLAKVLYSLFFFAGGVLGAAITAALAYFSNSYYSAHHNAFTKTWTYPYLIANAESDRCFRRARQCNWAAVAFAVASLIAWVVGLVFIGFGLVNFLPS